MTKSEVSSSAAVLMGQGVSVDFYKQTNKQKGYLLRQLGARHAEEGHRRVPGGPGPLPPTLASGQLSEQVGGVPDN